MSEKSGSRVACSPSHPVFLCHCEEAEGRRGNLLGAGSGFKIAAPCGLAMTAEVKLAITVEQEFAMTAKE